MAWPWLMRHFFHLTRCFRNLLQCSLGFGFPVKGLYLIIKICLPRAHTWCAPIACLFSARTCVIFFFKCDSEWREACGLFFQTLSVSPEFSVSEDEESNLMIQQVCEYSLMLCRCASLASVAMGSAIWLEDVYTGLSQLAFKKMLYLHRHLFC